jgi:predicted aconitase
MMKLSKHEAAILSGNIGTPGDQMAMELVVESARMLGADRLIPIESSHIDGCLYHGDSGVLYCEKLAEGGTHVKVPSTTNVGALNLLKLDQTRLSGKQIKMAYRLMTAHEKMGCAPSWTCAPYQTTARPKLGQQIAWGESNAVAFANSILGARTNRYGDFLDIACAISARAPYYGLHRAEKRLAELLIDVSNLSKTLLQNDAFFPVLGSMIGRLAGETVSVINGMLPNCKEDQLKALCAGAASTGSVALVHLSGLTPESIDIKAALGNQKPKEIINITKEMVIEARDYLSLAKSDTIDCVALGSPHFSDYECRNLLSLAGGKQFKVPVYVCTGRHTIAHLQKDHSDRALRELGVVFVVDTCVVVTPILPKKEGVMMTNSAKFAHYATGNTGYAPVFGSLADCVKSAQAGVLRWDRSVWK